MQHYSSEPETQQAQWNVIRTIKMKNANVEES